MEPFLQALFLSLKAGFAFLFCPPRLNLILRLLIWCSLWLLKAGKERNLSKGQAILAWPPPNCSLIPGRRNSCETLCELLLRLSRYAGLCSLANMCSDKDWWSKKYRQKLDKVRDGSDAEDQAFQKRLESLKQKAQASKVWMFYRHL